MTLKKRGGPLEGVRVLELTKVWAGPYAGKQLSFLGAEVIRVESEGSLDVTRVFGVDDINKAPGFMAVNPQKLSVQINMKSEEGISLLKDLVKQCDIVIENLRPGAIDRLGLGYETLKAVRPDIIFVSMSMYGNDGPLAYQTGYAPCFVALGGVSALVGYPGEAPAGMNVRYSDSTFGTAAAFAATAALAHRQRSGEGQYIDLSAVETMTSMIGDTLIDYQVTGELPEATGNRHADLAPHGVYPCGDMDWVAIAVSDDTGWRSLATEMGKPEWADDTRFATFAARKQNEDDLDELLAAWTREQDAGDVVRRLQAAGIAAAKSASSIDMVADDHLWARGFYQTVTDPGGETRTVLGAPWKMTDGAEIADGAPRLGQHNEYVLGELLGLSAEEQARLSEAGVTK